MKGDFAKGKDKGKTKVDQGTEGTGGNGTTEIEEGKGKKGALKGDFAKGKDKGKNKRGASTFDFETSAPNTEGKDIEEVKGKKGTLKGDMTHHKGGAKGKDKGKNKGGAIAFQEGTPVTEGKGTAETEEGKGKKGKGEYEYDKGFAKGGHIDRSRTFDYGNKGKSDSKGKTSKGKTDSKSETEMDSKGKTHGKGIGSIQQSPCKVGFGDWVRLALYMALKNGVRNLGDPVIINYQ